MSMAYSGLLETSPMYYDMRPILEPVKAHIDHYLLRVSPIEGDGVLIELVIFVLPSLHASLRQDLANHAVVQLHSLMEADLRQQAFDLCQDASYWTYGATVIGVDHAA